MNLACSLDEILEMCPGQEVSERDELAVVLILDIDDTPSVLATSNLSTTNNNVLLATDDCKWNDVLDVGIQGPLLIIVFLIIIWVHLQVVESKFFPDALLECTALFQGQRIGLGDHGYNVDDIGQLLEHDNIDRLQGMARWLNEEETAVDSGVLNVAISLSCEFFSEICGVLILDVLDNGVPATREGVISR